MKILVTGGMGYIGSHTIVDLVENGFDVISIDNFCTSNKFIKTNIERILGKPIVNYDVDLTNLSLTKDVFNQNKDILGVIHFAALKAVGESVEKPLSYYNNNLVSLINLLQCVNQFKIPHFVFSSSCTVYGEPDVVCVTEKTPLQNATSPYGATKQMGERIIEDFVNANNNLSAVLLRYFNPVGAHKSALIGELPIGKPNNLVPAITQFAIGKLNNLTVHGNNYNTRDGSCIRDYIHVCDIANAHTLSLKYLINKNNIDTKTYFNLGTGNGVTVLEAIKAFENTTNQKLNFKIGPKRNGDVEAIYANNDLAKTLLGWQTKFSLNEMMLSAWNWEKKISEMFTIN